MLKATRNIIQSPVEIDASSRNKTIRHNTTELHNHVVTYA